MEERKRKNPWLGLQSYQEGEVLYGRDDDIRDLTQCVINDTDTLLYGKSGIGKSSILNAGILPAARRFGYRPFIVRLDHKEPQSYLSQIKAVIGADVMREVIPCKDLARESLYEFFHRHTFHEANGERMKLLIIFDQFEEIFTLQGDSQRKKQFFAELADQLNDIVPAYLQNDVMQSPTDVSEMKVVDANNFGALFDSLDLGTESGLPDFVEDNDIHFVFTIREDFLSEFEYFTAAIPSLKQNRYCLRPINDEQAAQIILRPIPGLISKPVAKLILEKVTGRTDFDLDGVPEVEVDSAVLSLYLNRLYDACTGDVITTNLVEQKGGEIISDFYSDAISELSDDSVEYLEDKLLNGQGRRENVTIFDALASKHLTQQEISRLCNEKKILRQFNYAGDLRIELVHDILCPVVKAHKELRALLKEQEEEKRRLDAERQELIMQRQRDYRRFRRTMLWTVAIVILALGAYLINAYWNQWEYSEYYTAFTRQNGWPVGVGARLDEQARKQTAVFYRLSRKGRNGSRPFVEVQVCSFADVIIPNFRSPLVGTIEGHDIKAEAFSQLNLQVRTIRFTAENDATNTAVGRELYYDEADKLLYALNYYHSVDHNATSVGQKASFMWAVYVDRNGLPMHVRDNGADRMKVFLNSSEDEKRDRLEVKYMFYDEQGSPQCNDIGCYGFRLTYNDDLTLDSIFHLDPFSLENMVEVRQYQENKVTSTYYNIGAGIHQTSHRLLGHAKRVEILDDFGRIAERIFYMADGQLVHGKSPYAIERHYYDTQNREDSVAYFNQDGQQQAYILFHYSAIDNTPSELMHYELHRKQPFLTYARIRHTQGPRSENIEDDRQNGYFRHEIITTDSAQQLIEFSYVDRQGQPVFDSIQQCSRYVERSLAVGDGIVRVKRYYDIDGTLYRNPDDPRVPAIDSAYYDAQGMRRTQINFDADGQVLTSMGYDYKDGVEITRYALSLDGRTPIRCPEWEIDGLCYYKLNNVKNAQTDFNLAYIQAVSEYDGCSSYAYFPSHSDTLHYDFTPVVTAMGEDWQRQVQTAVIIPPAPVEAQTVNYIHITDLSGSGYISGLRDGDLLLEQNRTGTSDVQITALRYHRDHKRWEIIGPLHINETSKGFKIYPVAYTEEEYEYFSKWRDSL
jgi:hypothetical protein